MWSNKIDQVDAVENVKGKKKILAHHITVVTIERDICASKIVASF
jgi:hypothetical protein